MMFFRKTAQPTKEKQNAYITTVADEYLKHSFRKLDDKKLRDSLKGKFASLKYTLSGFDPSNLSYKEKLTLLSVLYDLNIEKLGKKQAVKDLEMVATRIKDRLGVKKAFEKGIQDLPEGVFEMERLEGMTKEGLEDKAKELVSELEKIKSLENRSTEKQTSELSSERDMLEAVLYNISDGVFALDRAGEIITFNKAMEELTGYRLEEVENKNADEFIRIFDASEPIETRFYCAMPDITPEPKGFTKDKITLVTRDGQKKYVKMTSVAIYESRQVNVGCIVTFKDITKEIDLESMKLDFVSMAAHELRTPLTIMRGYLSLLMDEAKDSLKEEYADYLEKTTVSSDQLHVLIENLLNISKIERGTLVL